ncbi:mitochondrial RNA-binding protein 2, putative [Bodo saltans]|uniref:Mitochondrial RNA-binding protein 2, putative n=1 Tax=Bodo saltans TaxID=75058 RepID=A0A0S4JSM9_BODSA|nr:mitochondrial RNA-binding protein 2, putative [Bodo saltans]|eukprot:CUG93202.1 mitochondrial RNA-binding protein 2, putative [Bodo saltans]
MHRVATRAFAPRLFRSVTAAGTAAVVSAPSAMMMQQPAVNAALRFQSSGRTQSGMNYNLLPPAFDLPRWDDDPSKGYCIRVSYTEERVVLTYIKQNPGTQAKDVAADAPAAATGGDEPNKVRRHGERLVSVYLPNVYIARFLAVLEGSMAKCDIASRQTTGTFSAGAEPNTFVLSCHSTNIPGSPNRPLEWTTELDAAASLMLHRFLTQSLHYNSGFQK